jgi:hypothetical protein
MVRRGRDLEILVAILEGHLSPLGIKVTSPDRIPDKDTGRLREVDVSLRSKLGSSKVLIILECRDRNDDEDVTWIEQLAKKKESVMADKAIAVSSSGFGENAIIKATKENIPLRTINQINPEEIGEWFRGEKVGTYVTPNSLLTDLSFRLSDGSEISGRGLDLDAVIFKRKKDGRGATLRDLWNSIPKPILYQHVPDDGTHIPTKFIVRYYKDGETPPANAIEEMENLKLVSEHGEIDIEEIHVCAELWVEVEKVPLKVKHYDGDDQALAEVAEFEFAIKGKKYAIDIIQSSLSDKKTFCVMPKGHKDIETIDLSFTATETGATKSKVYYGRLGQGNNTNKRTKRKKKP